MPTPAEVFTMQVNTPAWMRTNASKRRAPVAVTATPGESNAT